ASCNRSPSLHVQRMILLPCSLRLIRWLISSMFGAPIPGHTLSQSVPSKSTAYTIKFLFLIITSNLNRLIAFAVQDGVHHLNRSLVHASNQILKCACGLPRNQLYAFSVLICQKYIVSAIYVPEDHIRDFVSVFFVYSGNVVVEVFTVILFVRLVNLHIRNNNQRLRHFFL